MERSAFGAELRALRTLRGLSVVAAARRAGVSRVSLHRWEAGDQAPHGQALAALLAALGATPQERAALVADEPPSRARPALEGSPLGPSAHPGHMLRAFREGRSMTQAQLALAVGMSRSAVAMWEVGQAMPGDDVLKRVAAALGAEDLGLREGSLDLYDPIVDPFDARMRIRDRRFLPIDSLGVAHLLAIERELWPLAARDARWVEPLAEALAWRALGHKEIDEHTLALEAANRAIRLARSAGCWDAIFLAFLVLDDVRGWRGASSASLARLWEDYVGKVRNPRVRASSLLSMSYRHCFALDRASARRAFEPIASLVGGSEWFELYNDHHPSGPNGMNDVELMALNHALAFDEFDRAWEIYERLPGEGDRRLGSPEFDYTRLRFLHFDLHRATGQPFSETALGFYDSWARTDQNPGSLRFLREIGPMLGTYSPPTPPKPR